MTLQPERTAPRSPLKRTNRTRLKTALIIALVVLLVPYALAPLYRVVNPVSTLMLWRWGRPLRRDARQPNSGLRRLAAVIATRAASEDDSDRCIRFARRS